MEFDGHNVCINNGYYDVYYPTHPKARKNGCVMLQILIAEKILGRNLYADEVVHHIDCNRLNNSEDNLMVFATQADHACYHAYVTNINNNSDFVLYRINGVYHCISADEFFDQHKIQNVNGYKMKPCPNCGKLIYLQSNYCSRCRGLSNRKVVRPTRNQLKFDIRNNAFTTLSQKYGVSDNAIRKWCRQYGLPYKSSEIKKLSNDAWKYL